MLASVYPSSCLAGSGKCCIHGTWQKILPDSEVNAGNDEIKIFRCALILNSSTGKR
jgi:hypothetical protein